ncbi:hypothetical protein DID78_02645 [Candidatus Marinamargulisbacteria bacterium SCGC AG-343-D04]|nr:hypothetical protein DID78_02645 [Candidatus Marinamargulisbacteria bacterium SCGC AG-343-D04]
MTQSSSKNNFNKKNKAILFFCVSVFVYLGIRFFISIDLKFNDALLSGLFGFFLASIIFNYNLNKVKERALTITQRSKRTEELHLKSSLSKIDKNIRSLHKTLNTGSFGQNHQQAFFDLNKFPNMSIIPSPSNNLSYIIDLEQDSERSQISISNLKSFFKKRGHALKILKSKSKPIINTYNHTQQSTPNSKVEFPFSSLNFN